MTKADTIAVKLKTALQADFIEVLDVSHEHAGHGGWREGGETHFKLTITSPQFAGKAVYNSIEWLTVCLLMNWQTGYTHWKCTYLSAASL